MPAEPLTDDESMTLQKLRMAVCGIDRLSDGAVLRWLREYEHDAIRTARALREHVLFRRAWQLDETETGGRWSKVLQKYCHYGFCGPDVSGAPVLVAPFGTLDADGIFKSCPSLEYIKFCLHVIDAGVRRCEQIAADAGRPYVRLTLVFDLNHMNADLMQCKPFSATFLTLVSLYQQHYPNTVKKILVINAPPITRVAYQLINPLLSDATRRLIEIPPCDDWLSTVAKHVPMDNWPAALGGNRPSPQSHSPEHGSASGDGGGACSSSASGDDECDAALSEPSVELDYYIVDDAKGLERVPESYYVDACSDVFNLRHDTTVYPGDKHVIEVDVEIPGSSIVWQYATLSEDIGFAIYFDRHGANTADLNAMEPVYPYIRLECSQVPVSGTIECEEPGRYLIEFDNAYSWFSAKELRYNVELVEEDC